MENYNEQSSARYLFSLDIDQTSRLLVKWISDRCSEIRLLHWEQISQQTILTLFHCQWGRVAEITLIQDGMSRTQIRLSGTTELQSEQSEMYREQLLAGSPEEVGMLRLELAEGSSEDTDTIVCRLVKRKRREYLQQLDSQLHNSFPLDPQPERDNLQEVSQPPTASDQLTHGDARMLELWAEGCTARQIAVRTHRTEKTILNRLSWLRRIYGEQAVPRRKTV